MPPLHTLLAILLALSLAGPSQEPPRPEREADASRPGALPAEASSEARELWQELLAANLGRQPIRAFDLSFWMRHRSADGRQQNDLDARYRFLMPGWVRVELQSGREHLRGPRGDFLIDRGEATALSARTHVEDRRQLSETVAIARNFLSLTDPARLRVVRLALRDEPPLGLPESLAPKARGLRWLEVTSPDFHLASGGPAAPARRAESDAFGDLARGTADPPALYRAVLGLHPSEARIELAMIHEEVAGALALSSMTMLVDLQRHGELDGYRIPHRLLVHEVDLERSPWAFRERPTSELTLKPKPATVGLGPPLTPEDFLP